VLTWDKYTESPQFKEFKLYRGSGPICGVGSSILPLIGTIPKGNPTPATYTDKTAPDAVGMLCYEITAVDLIPATVTGGAATSIESPRSTRAIKFVTSSVPQPSNLSVQP
jgi:hypothetical protein